MKQHKLFVSIPLRIYFKLQHSVKNLIFCWCINSFKDIFQTPIHWNKKGRTCKVSIPLRIYFKRDIVMISYHSSSRINSFKDIFQTQIIQAWLYSRIPSINSFKDIFQTCSAVILSLRKYRVSIPLRIYFKPILLYEHLSHSHSINSFKDIFQTHDEIKREKEINLYQFL